MKISLFFTIITCLFSLNSFSKTGFVFGTYVPFPTTTQTENDGSTSLVKINPMLGVNITIPDFFLGHLLLPELGYVLHTGLEGEYSKKTIYVLTDLGLPITPTLVFRYGFGMFLTKVSGDGGSVDLGNGTSTSTFYYPPKSTTSYNTSLNLGFEKAFGGNWATRLQTYIMGFTSSTKRDISYSFTLNYYL